MITPGHRWSPTHTVPIANFPVCGAVPACRIMILTNGKSRSRDLKNAVEQIGRYLKVSEDLFNNHTVSGGIVRSSGTHRTILRVGKPASHVRVGFGTAEHFPTTPFCHNPVFCPQWPFKPCQER